MTDKFSKERTHQIILSGQAAQGAMALKDLRGAKIHILEMRQSPHTATRHPLREVSPETRADVIEIFNNAIAEALEESIKVLEAEAERYALAATSAESVDV